MSSRERAERDGRIVAARARRCSWPTIAREYGVSARQAQRIVRSWQDSDESEVDGFEELDALIVLLGQVVEDFAVIADAEQHAGYRIAALRGLVETAMAKFGLMRAAGRAPRELAAPRVAAQMRVVFLEFGELLRKHELPDEVLGEFLALAERQESSDLSSDRRASSRLALTTGAVDG